jgi:hypothetical protein
MTVSKIDLIEELEMDSTVRSCGTKLEDHDWTVHIPAHSHSTAIWDDKTRSMDGSFDPHPYRTVYVGPDSAAVALAIKTHPEIAFGECSWCAMKWDNDGYGWDI